MAFYRTRSMANKPTAFIDDTGVTYPPFFCVVLGPKCQEKDNEQLFHSVYTALESAMGAAYAAFRHRMKIVYVEVTVVNKSGKGINTAALRASNKIVSELMVHASSKGAEEFFLVKAGHADSIDGGYWLNDVAANGSIAAIQYLEYVFGSLPFHLFKSTLLVTLTCGWTVKHCIKDLETFTKTHPRVQILAFSEEYLEPIITTIGLLVPLLRSHLFRKTSIPDGLKRITPCYGDLFEGGDSLLISSTETTCYSHLHDQSLSPPESPAPSTDPEAIKREFASEISPVLTLLQPILQRTIDQMIRMQQQSVSSTLDHYFGRTNQFDLPQPAQHYQAYQAAGYLPLNLSADTDAFQIGFAPSSRIPAVLAKPARQSRLNKSHAYQRPSSYELSYYRPLCCGQGMKRRGVVKTVEELPACYDAATHTLKAVTYWRWICSDKACKSDAHKKSKNPCFPNLVVLPDEHRCQPHGCE